MRTELTAVVIAALVVAAVGFSFLRQEPTSGPCCTTSSVDISRSTVSGWEFTALLSPPVVSSDEGTVIYYNLTNISGEPERVSIADPLINPVLYAPNGSEIWEWNPARSESIVTIPPVAGNWSEGVPIPGSTLVVPGAYTLSVHPLICGNPVIPPEECPPISPSLALNLTITVV